MLLRLHVRGFKNLKDADIRFGPLTCFVGPNAVGKSNLFDAVQFLRHLSDLAIQEAAEAVRSPASGGFGPLDLIWCGRPDQKMSFVADMVVPPHVIDDFGREDRPSTTLLRYSLAFRPVQRPQPRLELIREDLRPLRKGDARSRIGFPHSGKFRDSIGIGARRAPLISTSTSDAGHEEIVLHQDGGSRGRVVPPGRSPRTVLGGTNAVEYPTVLAARREMASWQPRPVHGGARERDASRANSSHGGPAERLRGRSKLPRGRRQSSATGRSE